MITLNPFRLSPNTYFRIIVMRRFQKSWWIYVLCPVSALILFFLGDDTAFGQFLIVLGLLFPLILVAHLYLWANSRKNKSLFLERTMTLESDKLSVTSDGMYSELPYKHVWGVIETSEHLLLYIAESQFVYLPKSAFKDEGDIKTFREMLKK